MFIDWVKVQDHLYFVQPAGERAVLVGQFAVDAPAGHFRNWLGIVVDRGIQPQIPAAGVGDMELADIGKVAVQRGHNFLCFANVEIESPGIGKDDALMVKAQMHRVGTEPVAATGQRAFSLSQQAQCPKRGVIKAELFGQSGFKRALCSQLEISTRTQPFEARQGQFSERKLVVGFGPDQFWDKQGEAHGQQAGEL